MAHSKRGAEQGTLRGKQPLSRIQRNRKESALGDGHSRYKEQPVTGHMESIQEKLRASWSGVGGRGRKQEGRNEQESWRGGLGAVYG